MLLSMIFAWVAVLAAVLAALKYFAKKVRWLNAIFHAVHIPFGLVAILAGLIHGLLAGNAYGADLGSMRLGSVLFTINAGTICLILLVLLFISYLLRKLLRRSWMPLHRLLTLALLLVLAFHMGESGVRLPGILLNDTAAAAEETTQVSPETIPETTPEASTETTAASETTTQAAIDETTQAAIAASFAGASLKDGTYTGSADGYQSVISVTVTVENGSVTAIQVDQENDTPKFFDRAKAIIDDILNQQRLSVDAVSGATFSSKGILDAVENALQSAVSDGELVGSDIETPASKGHGGQRKNKGNNNSL